MFTLGILNIICGTLIIFPHLFKQFEYLTHSTENILIIIIGVIFLCTGFILIGISRIIKRIEDNSSDISDTLSNKSNVDTITKLIKD